jgi:hypothetical protein
VGYVGAGAGTRLVAQSHEVGYDGAGRRRRAHA